MKRILKIISFVSLILLLCTGLYGNNLRIRSFSIEQDTSGLNNKVRVDSFPLPIIPPSSGVQFFKDKIIFLSFNKNEKKMTPNHISFGTVDAYYASVLDSVAGKHFVFSPDFPFSFPCEAVTFNGTYDTIYFTKLDDNDIEKIFMARYSDEGKQGISGDIKAMEFCTGQYNYSHPTLSADGKTMIFASDKGSIGGMDLFISRRKGKVWSSPENLGNLINTAGNEFYPFLDRDNNLFFSSDGMKGSGGYDIFTCKYNGKGWDKPVSLSAGINSKYDDIAFTINNVDGKSAFFTRRSGKNGTQLFRIKVNRESNNLLSIFNGNPEPKTLIAVITNEEKPKPAEVEPTVTKPATKPGKNPEKKPSALNPGTKNEPPKSTVVKDQPAKTSDAKVITTKPTVPIPDNQKDIVIFRVQITTSNKPKKEKEIVINGKNYSLYEYFYQGTYRYCIGEFPTLQAAGELQRICRKSDYPQAFVAGFKNNTRVLDLKSLK